ncbi:MAG: hypothetical protein ACRC62_37680 [Microcoleus sp.]
MIIKVVQSGGRQVVKVYQRGLFSQGGGVGSTTADQVPLNPPVAGLPATVQGAIAALEAASPLSAPFSWGDATPAPIWTAPQGALVATVKIHILTAFNAPALLSIGDATDPGRLFPPNRLDPMESVEWEYTPQHRYTANTPILLSIQQNGATQGNGIIYLDWRI